MPVNPPESILYGIPLSLWGTTAEQVKARLNYASYVSRKHRYVYVETPKVACTQLKMLIHRLEGLPAIKPDLSGPVQTRPYMYIHARHTFLMPSLVQLPYEETASILRKNAYFRFCFVRNPYSRLVSVWRNKVYLVDPHYEDICRRARELYPEHFEGKFLRFSGFVQFLRDERNHEYSNPHWALQSSLLFPRAIHYDLIGKLENFQAGIAAIEKATGISFAAHNDQRLPNASVPQDWRSYYNEELAKQVYTLYRTDFATFGYTKDSWQGGNPLLPRTHREAFLEEEIYQRNRMITLLSKALKDRKPA